jgi:hypothetical protein
MSSVDTIPIGVKIDGHNYHPPGWMFIWACAMDGFTWAIAECAKPEFKAVVDAWHAEHPDGVLTSTCCSGAR